MNQLGLGPRSFGLVLFARFWSKIWTNFGHFRGLECSKAKNKATFVTEPQKVRTVEVTIFLQFEHSNTLKLPKPVRILDQNHAKRTRERLTRQCYAHSADSQVRE